ELTRKIGFKASPFSGDFYTTGIPALLPGLQTNDRSRGTVKLETAAPQQKHTLAKGCLYPRRIDE
ncbi:MAG: hypothetical protein SVX43_22660, partial [Cyanobacteriota bacterium]|nr:hypothetical protein [Cyanobacteriota bacterium]